MRKTGSALQARLFPEPGRNQPEFERDHTNAAIVIRRLREEKQPMIITQNGEARIVVQDIESYERTEETLALLKILALGNRQVEQGKVTLARLALKKVNERRKRRL